MSPLGGPSAGAIIGLQPLWSAKACPAILDRWIWVLALPLVVAPPNLQNQLTLTSEGQRSVDAIFTCVDLHVDLLVSSSINMLSVTDFVPKRFISGVRVQAGLYLDMLDADRSPNAVSVHAGTSQVDFEVDCRHLQLVRQEIF